MCARVCVCVQKHDAVHILIHGATHYKRFESARKRVEDYVNEGLGEGAAFRIPETKGFYRGPGAQGAGEAASPEGSESDGDESD